MLLTEVRKGKLRIKDNPPLIYHPPDNAGYDAQIQQWLRLYRDSLPPERRPLLERYQAQGIEIAAQDADAHLRECRGRGIRPGERGELMSSSEQFDDGGRTDPAGGTGDENAHDEALLGAPRARSSHKS